MTPQEKSKLLQERRAKIQELLRKGPDPKSSPVTLLSIEEQRKLGIDTDSVYLDWNPLKRA